MATESYTQVPANSSGNKIRSKSQTVGANTVHTQIMDQLQDPTWYVWGGSLACALNKHFLSFLNNTGSAQVIRVRGLYLINTALAAVTGVGLQFDIKRVTALSGGSTITPQLADSADTALSNTTCQAAPTSVTEGAVLFSHFTNNDEIGLTGAFPWAVVEAGRNLVRTVPGAKDIVLNAAEGITVKQITSSAVGSFAALMVLTKDT